MLSAATLINAADKEKIAHLNAEHLFGLSIQGGPQHNVAGS
jgi:hypothetical protein